MMLILEVTSIDIQIAGKGDKQQAVISVQGTSGTPGWTNLNLKMLEKDLPKDGILDLEFLGTPPDVIVIQVLNPVMATLVLSQSVDRLVGVRVVAKTNEKTQLVAGNGLTTAAIREEIMTLAGFEDPFRRLGTEALMDQIDASLHTTLVQFEETLPPPNILMSPGDPQKPFFGKTEPRVDQAAKQPHGEQQNPFGRRNPFGSR